MKYNITESEGFSLATITAPSTKTVVAYLSVDIHTEQSALLRATELLYTDALISGAGKYNRETFLDAINSLGATISAGISDGVLTIFIRCDGTVFKKVLALVEIMLEAPHFNKEELKRIKQTVTNALKESKEDTRAIAHEQLRNAFYGPQDRRYTYDEDTLISAITRVTAKDLQSLHKKVRSLGWTCSVSGNPINAEMLKKGVAKLRKGSHKTVATFGIHQQKPPYPSLTLKDIPSKQNIDFSIGAPVPITLHHPDFIPLMFGIAVLGKWGGFTGRLMSTVREQEGLTYGIYAKTETFFNEEQGYWRIMSFFAPEKALQGLTSTFREIKKLYQHGITESELKLFKQILSTAHVLQNDSLSSQLNDLHGYHMQKFSLQEIAEHKSKIHSLTRDEVNSAIKHYLNPAYLTVSGAGPTAKVRGELQTFMKNVS
ncbi:MAG: insulinase family protein [Candidatus Pacebacteria bacterium]|nr:insulinase family protein [Candidatus Paceibacterota bacterium]